MYHKLVTVMETEFGKGLVKELAKKHTLKVGDLLILKVETRFCLDQAFKGSFLLFDPLHQPMQL